MSTSGPAAAAPAHLRLAPFVDEIARQDAAPVEHVYAHFPFCARKCPYCDFNSHAGRDAEMGRYVDALAAEATAWSCHLRPRTIFVGGGTPTHAPRDLLARYLAALRLACADAELEEFTIEANPGSLDVAKVRALRAAGVDRVSLGVQSFDDRHLVTLGRVHSAADALRAVEILRREGIERFSLDLILAIPGQTIADQARDLERALDLQPEHVSAYVLTVEEGTAYARMMREGRLPAPDDRRELAHLQLAVAMLTQAGYERYEISNFARPGAACRHNLAYWRSARWIGLGAGAHSHAAGRRWKNVDDPAEYAARVEAGRAPIEWAEGGDPERRVFESLMMGLRLGEGIDLQRLGQAHGIDVHARHAAAIEKHLRGGLLSRDGAVLRLTARGFDLANRVIADFLP